MAQKSSMRTFDPVDMMHVAPALLWRFTWNAAIELKRPSFFRWLGYL